MSFNIVVPDLGESVVEATIARWLKHEGDPVSVGEAVVVLETEKVDLEVGAEKDGVLATIQQPDGTDVKVGDVLGVIDDSAGQPAAAAASRRQASRSNAAPAARQRPLPPKRSSGGDAGRQAHRQRASGRSGAGRAEQAGSGASPRPTWSATSKPARARRASTCIAALRARPRPASAPRSMDRRVEERVKLSRRRRTIAQRLVEAQHSAAMLTTFNEIDMTGVMELRERRKEIFKERYGVSLGLSSFFVKAAIGALKFQPRLNAEIQGDEMILKHYYDIGIAVGAEEGLVVPGAARRRPHVVRGDREGDQGLRQAGQRRHAAD